MQRTEDRQTRSLASLIRMQVQACDFSFLTSYALSHMSIPSKYPHQESEDEKSNYALPIQNHTTSWRHRIKKHNH